MSYENDDAAGKTFLQRVAERQEREAAQQQAATQPVGAKPAAGEASAWAQRALTDEFHAVATATQTQGRNHQLNVSAFNLGQIVGAGHLPESETVRQLTIAARMASANGDHPLTEGEIAATIDSGINAGKAQPRHPEPRETYGPAFTIDPPAADGQNDDESPQYTNFAALLADGLPDPPKPSVLQRTDGTAVFYEGKRNELYGDPEDGKTMVALAAAAERLQDGGNVAFLDLDNNGDVETAQRLLMLGAPREAVADQQRFRHIEPDDASEVLRVVQDCAGWADLVIIDCVGELIPLFGGNSDSADDYTRIMQRVAAPLEHGGAAVLLLDHQAKNPDSRAYGAGGTMAKRRAISGASINLKAKRLFTPGVGGTAELWINKDRPGGLRRHCPTGTGRRQLAGTFVLDAPDTTGRAAWRITPEAADTVTTTFDTQAIEYLEAARELPQPFTVDDLATRIGGEVPATESQRETARRNIDRLTADGQLEVVRQPKRGRGGAGQWGVVDPR